MEQLIGSVIGYCGTVSQTERQYSLQFKKLSYELQKAQHIATTDKVNNVPGFILENLHQKIDEAKKHLAKIQSILTQDRRIPFKQKLKLSLPFNKTLTIAKTLIQDLQKAQQDVNEYGDSAETKNNGKRFVDENQQFQKKQQAIVSLVSNDQTNDQDIEKVSMGPTIYGDAEIQCTRNKYILVTIELCGDQKIINFIKELDKNFLVVKNKILVKFEKSQDKFQDIELFSLGREKFRSIYLKLKEFYPEIDRISKKNHFMIKLRRSLVSSKELKIRQIKQEATKSEQDVDELFQFPVLDQQITMIQVDTFILQGNQKKTVYLPDSQGTWVKMVQTEKQLTSGECIAPFIPPNRNPQIPDIYYKVQFQFIQ